MENNLKIVSGQKTAKTFMEDIVKRKSDISEVHNFEKFLKLCESTCNQEKLLPCLVKSIGNFYENFVNSRKDLFNLVGLDFQNLTLQSFSDFQLQVCILETTLEENSDCQTILEQLTVVRKSKDVLDKKFNFLFKFHFSHLFEPENNLENACDVLSTSLPFEIWEINLGNDFTPAANLGENSICKVVIENTQDDFSSSWERCSQNVHENLDIVHNSVKLTQTSETSTLVISQRLRKFYQSFMPTFGDISQMFYHVHMNIYCCWTIVLKDFKHVQRSLVFDRGKHLGKSCPYKIKTWL